MLSGSNDFCKTLCPVCNSNYILKNFKSHMVKEHKDFCEIVNITDELYELLYKATSLKNVTNYVYYNWDYHIQTKYKVTQDDENNYNTILSTVRPLNPENILTEMAKLNPLFQIRKLAINVFKILSS
jgi:hypothetical protein